MIIPLMNKLTDTVWINLCPGTDADEFNIGFRYVRLKRIFRRECKKNKRSSKIAKTGSTRSEAYARLAQRYIEECKNPWYFGEPLEGDYAGLWRYRVGDYRILCYIQDKKIKEQIIKYGDLHRDLQTF